MSIDMSIHQGSFDDFLSHLAKEVVGKGKQLPAKRRIEQLREAGEALKIKHDFAVGDFATWKEGLRNMNFRGPFLIVELLAEPIIDRELSHASSYAESLDTVILFIDKDGDASRSVLSRARIEPYKGEETEQETPATEV